MSIVERTTLIDSSLKDLYILVDQGVQVWMCIDVCVCVYIVTFNTKVLKWNEKKNQIRARSRLPLVKYLEQFMNIK